MAPNQEFRNKQRGVSIAVGAALVISVAIYLLFGSIARASVVDADKLYYAVQALLGPGLCQLSAIAAVAKRRYFSEIDIDGAVSDAESQAVAAARAVLTNTSEQLILAIILYPALAMLLAGPQKLLAALAAAFVIGRITFAFSYARGAAARAFGFGLTFYPQVIGLFLLSALVIGG